MNILICADDPEFRLLIRRHLQIALPAVKVREWSPSGIALGPPPTHDVLVVDHTTFCRDALNGVDGVIGPAGTVVVAGRRDPLVEARVTKRGVAACLWRAELTTQRLAGAIKSAMARRGDAAADGGPRAESADPEQPGQPLLANPPAIPGFAFHRLLGEGALSRVYLVTRQADRLQCVLKVLDLDLVGEGEFLDRFIREAEFLGAIDSPYVVKVYGQGFTDDFAYIVMERFTGGDLRDRIDAGLSRGEALGYCADILRGLDIVHRRGIAHRDLRPENVMFGEDGRLVITDFGIAKSLDTTSNITLTGKILGTPHYMSPEQAQGQKADARSDLYSAGVILYEMLTGERPFRALSAIGLIRLHIYAEVPPLPASLAAFQPVINKALAKDPGLRFQSARRFLAALEEQGSRV